MSLTPKVPLNSIQCKGFAEDERFEKIRANLQEKGLLKEWTDIAAKYDPKKAIEEVFDKPMMDNVAFLQDRFEIVIDASGFRPEDIKCSLTPNFVEVVARKEEQINTVKRNMVLTRSYLLPQNVRPEEAMCCFSSEGILVITAPWGR